MSHTTRYLEETRMIAGTIMDSNASMIEEMVQHLVALRERKGRLWIAGLGGSAANASHAANDFQQLCDIQAHCVTDNVARLTARANDFGWEKAIDIRFSNADDALFILSVGGGSSTVSTPLVDACQIAESTGMPILGIVGRDGGYTAKHGHCVIIVPTVEHSRVTPHTEGWQSVILHCIVSHPDLQVNKTKW